MVGLGHHLRNGAAVVSRNLVAGCDVYRDGNLWVVLQTGMPEVAVQIGIGETLREAYDSREGTPVQSTGRDSGRLSALTWAHNAGWIGDPDSLEEEDSANLGDDTDPQDFDE